MTRAAARDDSRSLPHCATVGTPQLFFKSQETISLNKILSRSPVSKRNWRERSYKDAVPRVPSKTPEGPQNTGFFFFVVVVVAF